LHSLRWNRSVSDDVLEKVKTAFDQPKTTRPPAAKNELVALFEILSIPVEKASMYISNLEKKGARCTADLARMEESELMEAGFKQMDARKILKAVQEAGIASSAPVSKKTRRE
jgi:hypothetical protein